MLARIALSIIGAPFRHTPNRKCAVHACSHCLIYYRCPVWLHPKQKVPAASYTLRYEETIKKACCPCLHALPELLQLPRLVAPLLHLENL
jgi:hypothetical protein